MKAEILRMDNIWINFSKERVYNVSINLFRGEILGLVGLNDSGKSAVVKLLAGKCTADEGRLYIDNNEVPLDFLNNSRRREISCIYDKPQLIPNLTIAENIFVIRKNSLKKIKINEKAIYLEAAELLKRIGCSLDPKSTAENLTKAEQHLILIAKALSMNSKVIVIDNIAGSYTKQELNKLKEVLLNISEKGISVIFASNQFFGIMDICHRITLFREGTNVKTLYKGEYSKKKISAFLVGYTFSESIEKETRDGGEEILRVRSLFSKNTLSDINFYLNIGEVLGILDLEGTNTEELLETLFNPKLRHYGYTLFKGRTVAFKNYRDALNCGIGVIPEGGMLSSVFYNMSITENIVFMRLRKISRFLVISSRLSKFALKEFAGMLNIEGNQTMTKMKELNKHLQQRIVMYRWLLAKPQVLIMIKPTSGTDVVGKKEVYSFIDIMRKKGTGIIILSTDPGEILGLSDRVIVLNNGRIEHEFVSGECTKDMLRELI